jgi:hypothetical protein
MTSRRRTVARAVLLAVVAGAVLSTASLTELWPFSPYPMFARLVPPDHVARTRVLGLPADGGPPFVLRGEQIEPFGAAQLRDALNRVAMRPDRDRALQEALRDLLARYEAGRREGRHDGAALRGLRLERAGWRIDPEARNLERPDWRETLAEIAP